MSKFISDSLNNQDNNRQEIDFDDAIRLPDGGSACEIYRTKWQRHEVFVKRLKPEYRTNPLYLDALDKEYEIGVSLKHPALPDYREFHRDYIVMDFIDGQTLDDMIKRQDNWLKNEKNIVRMLRELVEVVDYLHRHNVTHCDIKPDNIMITANNKNLVLIDFDKCYSDSLNDTSGDPSKYGLPREQQGRITIDFLGAGRVLEIMKEKIPDFKFRKYNEFVKECRNNECTADKLLDILDYKPSNSGNKKIYWMITLAPFIVALIYGGVLLILQGKNGYDDNYGIDEPTPQETDSVNLKPSIPVPVSQEQIHLQAQEMATQLDKVIGPYFDELNTSLDSIEKIMENPDLTSEQLSQVFTIHMNKEDEYFQETFEILKEMYPSLNDREAWRILGKSKVYTSYNRKASALLKRLENRNSL